MKKHVVMLLIPPVNRFSFKGLEHQTLFQLKLTASLIKEHGTILQKQRGFATGNKGQPQNLKSLRNALFEHKQQGRWREALETIAEMKRTRFTPNSADYTAAIAVCGKHGRVEHAMELHADMKISGVRPDVRSYTALISACGNGMKWKEAVRMFQDMRALGLKPDVITYSALISALAKGSQWEEALRVFREMRERGLEPDVITYSALLSVLVGCYQWDVANSVFEDALTDGSLVLTMNLDRCVIDLHGLCSAVAKLAVCRVMRQVGEADEAWPSREGMWSDRASSVLGSSP